MKKAPRVPRDFVFPLATCVRSGRDDSPALFFLLSQILEKHWEEAALLLHAQCIADPNCVWYASSNFFLKYSTRAEASAHSAKCGQSAELRSIWVVRLFRD